MLHIPWLTYYLLLTTYYLLLTTYANTLAYLLLTTYYVCTYLGCISEHRPAFVGPSKYRLELLVGVLVLLRRPST